MAYKAYLYDYSTGDTLDTMQDASITRLRARIIRNWGSRMNKGGYVEIFGGRGGTRMYAMDYNPKNRVYEQVSNPRGRTLAVQNVRRDGTLGAVKNKWDYRKEKREMASKPKPIAIKPTSGFGGMAIYDYEYGINDYVIWGYTIGPEKKRRSKIYYTKTTDRAYFKNNGRREYLDEFIMYVGRN